MTCLTVDPTLQEDRGLRLMDSSGLSNTFSTKVLTMATAATLLACASVPVTIGTQGEFYFQRFLVKNTVLTGAIDTFHVPMQSVGTTTDEDSGPLLGPALYLETDQKLWSIAKNPHYGLDARLNALNELADREEPRVSEFISSNLLNERIGFPWRVALTHLAERLAVKDASARSQLADALHFNAQALKTYDHKAADAPLWSAIRKLGGLLDPESGNLLLDFLRRDDRLRTRQVALQAVQSLATGGPERLPAKLKDRITELALSYTNPDWLISGETVSLAANAIAAATLSEVACTSTLLASVKALESPLLERQIHLSILRSGGGSSAYSPDPSPRS